MKRVYQSSRIMHRPMSDVITVAQLEPIIEEIQPINEEKKVVVEDTPKVATPKKEKKTLKAESTKNNEVKE